MYRNSSIDYSLYATPFFFVSFSLLLLKQIGHEFNNTQSSATEGSNTLASIIMRKSIGSAVRRRRALCDFFFPSSSSSKKKTKTSSYSTSSSQNIDSLREDFRYASATLRRYDYETYLCTNAIDANKRAGPLALRALNCETAGITTATVSEKEIALVKLKWWHEHAESMFTPRTSTGEKTKTTAKPLPEHPIARCVNAVATHAKEVLGSEMNETRYVRWIKRAIEARMEDVDKGSSLFDSTADLETFARETHGNFLLVTLDCENIRSMASDHVASHLGTAIGLTNSLRGAKINARNRKTYFPMDLLAAENVSAETVYEGQIGDERIKNATHKIASAAVGHLAAARRNFAENKLGEKYPHMAKLLLQATTTERWLEKLEKYDFDVFRDELQRTPPLLTQGRVFVQAWKNQF
jgi:NADH dehydrogenase [ubiquinone] 1 alpha subcomplex assembly factor 6